MPATAALGLYGGRTGIAVAAAWVGRLVDEPGLIERAASPLDSLPESEEFDRVAGRAGAVIGLLILARLLGDASFQNRAISLG